MSPSIPMPFDVCVFFSSLPSKAELCISSECMRASIPPPPPPPPVQENILRTVEHSSSSPSPLLHRSFFSYCISSLISSVFGILFTPILQWNLFPYCIYTNIDKDIYVYIIIRNTINTSSRHLYFICECAQRRCLYMVYHGHVMVYACVCIFAFYAVGQHRQACNYCCLLNRSTYTPRIFVGER